MEYGKFQTRKDFLKQSAMGLLAITAAISSIGVFESFTPVKKEKSIRKRSSSVTPKEFREGIMPRAQLSKGACEIALLKATNKSVRQFVEWELMEAKTVIKVLEDAGTTVLPLAPKAIDFLDKLKSLSGNDFDKEFMQAQLSNHEFLRDLAANFINGYDKQTTGKQEIGHLSNLALFAFTEHVGLSKNIIATL
ncbi:MAG: DUF4142 domain-containing protein [Chitinophaga sp.]|uniref:DUF4142 domain-containing protein n=1 Tax=Chitinophaga sp. TaxID=1869181 RepID=UPI001B0CDE87|nr:DUF4142 domain-containing protein [Chitinophaga sp.]MBO9727106.1 DUF4142 domain-containing protein [Chitinophaga sp.]